MIKRRLIGLACAVGMSCLWFGLLWFAADNDFDRWYAVIIALIHFAIWPWFVRWVGSMREALWRLSLKWLDAWAGWVDNLAGK